MGSACQQDQPVARPALELTGRVVDAADLLTASEERLLTAKLAALETHEGAQFVVVTTPSLGTQSIDDYSIGLARAWRLGSKERNDGVMLLVAPKERRVRIEVGKGLEPILRDELCGRIIREQIMPRFRASDMRGGISTGVDAIISLLQTKSIQPKAKAA